MQSIFFLTESEALFDGAIEDAGMLEFINDDLFIDPDFIRVDTGDNSRGNMFVRMDIGDAIYIISYDELSDKEKHIIATYFTSNNIIGGFYQNFKEIAPSSWDAFTNTDNAIAYRGGTGYAYALWEYIG